MSRDEAAMQLLRGFFSAAALLIFVGCAGRPENREEGAAAMLRQDRDPEQHVEVGVFYGSTID